MSGNKARQLAIAAVNGLGLEGSGVMAPGTLNPDYIQAVREHGQFGFGDYAIKVNPDEITILDGLSGAEQLITKGVFNSSVQGFANQDKESRILAAHLRLVITLAGAAALAAAGAVLETAFELGYSDTGIGATFVPVIITRTPFAATQTVYEFSIYGGGSITPAVGDYRLLGSYQGWVPALVSSRWRVFSNFATFPAGSSYTTKSILVQQPKNNRVPL